MLNQHRLQKLRKRIESIDRQIIKILARRFKLSDEIQRLKKLLAMELNQKKRETALISKYAQVANRHGLPDSLIKKLFTAIFSYSKKSGIIKRTKKKQWTSRPKTKNQ